MSITKAKKDLLETILGSEISIPSKTIKIEEMISRENILEVVSSDLYNSLSSFFDASAPFFKTSLPLERIIRYRDGTFSSMEKSLKGGISQHEGYEIINSIDIAQQLMSYVMPCLNMKLASLYSDLVNQNTDYLNQIQKSWGQVFHCANNFSYHYKRQLLCTMKDLTLISYQSHRA